MLASQSPPVQTDANGISITCHVVPGLTIGGTQPSGDDANSMRLAEVTPNPQPQVQF